MSDLIVIDRLLISVFAALLIMAAAYDLKSFRIPNILSLLMLALYPWHVLFAPEPVDWIMASCVAAAVFAVGVGLFVFRLDGRRRCQTDDGGRLVGRAVHVAGSFVCDRLHRWRHGFVHEDQAAFLPGAGL